ncbi:signal peptidase I [Streptomyces kaniharaensis]|nr:signal peptidase I [Streptomyces kaniharaensis]
MKKRRMRLVWTWIAVAVAGLVMSGLGLAVVLTGYSLHAAQSQAMSPTVEPGDVLLTDRVDASDVRRGEVYVVDSPWTMDGLVFERVMALGGDRIACQGGRLTLNGQPPDEPAERQKDSCRIDFDVTVQPGRAFLMGDFRADAFGSRYHNDDDHQGTVDLAKVHERVIWHSGTDTPPLPGKLVGAIVLLLVGPLLLVVGKIAAVITTATSGRHERPDAPAAAQS